MANTGFLDPGEIWTYSCDSPGLTDGVANIVTVTGQPVTPGAQDPIGDVVTSESFAEVEVQDADLQLTKDADPRIGLPGTTVTYTFELTNPASATAVMVPPAGTTREDAVVDDGCTPLVFDAATDTNDDSRLEPGETWVYTCDKTYPNPTGTINIAGAVMEVEGLGDRLTRIALERVLILPPAVDITKRASEGLVRDGDSVTYTYEVTNPGAVELQDVTVVDTAGPGTCAPVTFVGGDDGDGLLQPGELWTYDSTTTLTKPAPSNTPATIDNTAQVTGTPTLNGQTGTDVTATAPAEVVVIDPSIDLEKTVSSPEVRTGGTVTWTATVTNTGDTQLFNPIVSDDNCTPMVLQPAAPRTDIMAVGEVRTYTCSGPVPADITNTADVVAGDVLGGEVTDSDQATVTVFDPSIELVKTVSTGLVPEGTPVGYTYVATNTGDDQLSNVVIADDRCSPLAGPTGDTGGDSIMDPGEAWTWFCSSTPITGPTVNIAGVRATDHLGGPVVAGDFAFVDSFIAGIDIVKTAAPTLLVGPGAVTYSYVVTNTGEVPLEDVKNRITDDKCSPVTYVSGDDDGNELLTGETDIFETGPEEDWHFTCTTTISVDTLNTVVVEGVPVRPGVAGPQAGAVIAQQFEVIGPPVTATDDAFVEVLDPATIVIEKDSGDDIGIFAYTGDLGAFTVTTAADTSTGSVTHDNLARGTYEVTEQPLDGWQQTGLTCDDPTEDTTTSGATATIALAEGETVTCTYTNNHLPLPDTGADRVIAAIFEPSPTGQPRWPSALLVLLSLAAAGAAGGLYLYRRRGRS
jgi:uncharacterized repeat protein (TIGR01451 family)